MRAVGTLAVLAALAAIPPGTGRAEEPAAAPSPTLEAGVVQGFLLRSRDEVAIGDALVTMRGTSPAAIEARTGEDGWFRIPGVPIDADFTLEARAEGQPPVVLEGLRVPLSGTLDLDEIPVGAPVRRSWRVLDRRGRPIAGARVEFRRRQVNPLDELRYARPRSPRPAAAAAISGEDGIAVLSSIPPGVGLLEIRADGHATEQTWIDLRDGERYGVEDVVLGRGFGFRGRLRDAGGRALPGVALLASDPTWRYPAHFATTGPEGRFEFGGLPPGDYQVQAITPRGLLAGLAVVQVPGTRSIDLVLDLTASIEGRVLDHRSGKPIPGAPIQLEWMDPGFVRGRIGAIADAEGRYRIEGVPPGRLRDVRCPTGGVYLDSYSIGFDLAVRLVPHCTTRLDLRWIPGPAVRGRAVDETGAGVPRVLVSAVVNGPWGHQFAVPVRTAGDGTYRLPLPCEGNGFVDVRAPHHYAAGYPENEWRFAQVDAPPGRYAFRASEDRECVLDLPLRPGGAVEGVVRGWTGVPAEGAIVVVRQVGGGPGGGGRTAPTGADGKFRVRGVAPGEGPLFGWAPLPGGGEAWSRHVTLPVGEEAVAREVAVAGERPNYLDGRVVESTPGDLDEGELRLVSQGRATDRDVYTPPPFANGVVVPVDADGRFRTTVTHGDYALVWSVRGCYVETGPQVTVKEGETRDRLVVRTPAATSLAGRVMDEAGRPIEAAEISLRPARDNTAYPEHGNPGWMDSAVLCTTDEEGRFALDAMPGLHYDAEVLVPGRPVVRCRVTAGGPVAVAVPRGVSLRGRVVDERTGAPLPGIVVGAGNRGEPSSRGSNRPLSWRAGLRGRSVTGPDGSFEIHGLEQGRNWIVAEDTPFGDSIGDPGRDVEYLRVRVDAVECPRDGIEIEMSPGLSIAGVVLDRSGRPARHLRVAASPEAAEQFHCHSSTTTDSAGRFRLGGLLAGVYEVEVSRLGDDGPPIVGKSTLKGVAAGRTDAVMRVTRRDEVDAR